MIDRTDAGKGAGGRGVIDAAFGLLDRVGVMEPVRLVDLAEATGIPQPTVYRLLETTDRRGSGTARRGSVPPG